MHIYIGFSRPRQFKIGAQAISLWTNRPYSHVYLRFAYSDSKDAIFHAAHGMVHFRSVNNFNRDNISIKEYKIDISSKAHVKLFDDCMEMAGEDYGFLELPKIFISDLVFYLTKKEICFDNSSGYICSELIGVLCKDSLELYFEKPMHLLKPSDIDNALSKKYGVL